MNEHAVILAGGVVDAGCFGSFRGVGNGAGWGNCERGRVTQLPNGRYPADAIPEYIRFIRDGKARKHHDIAAQVELEKLRKLRRENDLEESKVAPVFLLTDALQKAGAIIVANLESLPLLIKRHWPEVTGDQITMVKAAVAECRNTVADMRIDLDA